MSKTLVCPGPPKHFFTHKGGRGRPPKYCDEHKPQKKSEPVTDVTVTEELAANPFIKKAQASVQDAPKPKRGRVKKVEPEPEKLEDLEHEYNEIDAQISRAKTEYDEAFKKANAIGIEDDVDFTDVERDFNHAWNVCDKKMTALVNMLARKRKIEKHVEELTSPDAVQAITVTKMGTEFGSLAPTVVIENEDEAMAMINAEAADEEEFDEGDDSLPINDLLSNPEQFDDDTADRFAAIMEEFEE